MMQHAMVTIAAPIAVDRIAETVEMIMALGNPANESVASKLSALNDDKGVHFVSLHALHPVATPRRTGFIVLEFSADGEVDEAIAQIVQSIGDDLMPIFERADNWRSGGLLAYLRRHRVHSGFGLNALAGLPFAGTPGMSVGRIRKEAQLADHLRVLVLGQTESQKCALDRLNEVRDAVRTDPDYAWALTTPENLPAAPKKSQSEVVFSLIWSFLRTYLWVLALPALFAVLFGLNQLFTAISGIVTSDTGFPHKLWALGAALWTGLGWLLGVAGAFLIPLALAAAALYLRLIGKEKTDWTSDLAPDRNLVRKILEVENLYAQNHMVSITAIKPGITRKITLRLAFWIIAQLARLRFPPGFLGDIQTIHFARWVQLPGTRDLVFFSNYGGSWESYLEDFITRAHQGLTAVWSNTVGFPRTRNLFQDGATDGERFKRFARHSMAPTPFWYSAYPDLTTSNIRTNSVLRMGLAVAMTEGEAALWLAHFGSMRRPVSKLETTEIQSLTFGGLGFKPFGSLVILDLSDNQGAARDWLGSVLPEVAFGDGRHLPNDAVLTLALGPEALVKLGLDENAIASFPPAFLDGMTSAGRMRLLGDDPASWQGWRLSRPHDVALLVYGSTQDSVDELIAKLKLGAGQFGHEISMIVPLDQIPKDRRDRKEPFGFVDGTSQPVIRGTYRGLRNGDPLHLVEAGEFIMGYPDNRGNMPPAPTLFATKDPENILPVVGRVAAGFAANTADLPRDVGRNGSFLAVRQLEQNTKAFDAYCKQEAKRLSPRLTGPFTVDADYIGAKMIGRWPDGSSLVRNPYVSYSKAKNEKIKPTSRVTSNPDGASTSIAAAPASAAVATSPIVGPETEERRRALQAEDNDFLFGEEDPEGLRCPFGAHVRRAYPRDSFDPGSFEQIGISNRHRILRVGRSYTVKDGRKTKRGLMFMCLNADIERQFEFVQQTWLRSETFHGLSAERDPLAVHSKDRTCGFTIPTRDGPVGLAPMQEFVTTRGGGYFFLPGRALLRYLVALPR